MNHTPLIRRYTEADVERWFGAHEIAKARPYVAAIDRIEIDGDRIAAWVQGSAKAPYRVRVDFRENRRSGVPIGASCTCPVGAGCKHAAALLLAALARRAAAGDEVRPEVREWLTQLQGLINVPAGHRPAPKRAAAALFYVIGRESADGARRIRFLKAPLGPDGRMGRGAAPWTNYEAALVKPPAFIGDDDLAILRLLWAQRGRDHFHAWEPGLPLTGRHLDEALPRLLASGRVLAERGDGMLCRLEAGAPRAAELRWAVEAGGTRARLTTTPAADSTIAGEPPWYVDFGRGEAGRVEIEIDPQTLGHLLRLPALAEAEARAVAASLEQLAPAVPRPVELATIERVEAPLRAVLTVVHGFDGERRADNALTVALPRFRYGDATLAANHVGEFTSAPDGRPLRVRRDAAAERRLLAALDRAGLTPLARHAFDPDGLPALPVEAAGDVAYALPDEDDWLDFEDRIAPELADAGWTIHLPDDYLYRLSTPDAWFAELDEAGGDYALAMGIEVGGQRLALAPLIHVMLHGDPRWLDAASRAAIPDDEAIRFKTGDGFALALPAGRLKPLVEVLVDLLDRPSTSPVRVSALDAARLVEATAGALWRTRGLDTARTLHERLRASAGVAAVAAPEGFGATLRPYQLQGLAWLQYLREHGLGGILADDMGLGKTAQALAHLLTEQRAGRLGPAGGGKPALVVLPTSLIFNWKREAARFAPQLSVLSLHGVERKERFDAIPQHDIVLTTYPLLWRDAAALTAHEYHSLILDEAQTVKNAASRAAETVRILRADHRLCLTGTPLENHLGELWAQFDFLLPGFLGDARSFARDWRTPIEKRGDTLRRDVLARRLRPFILRRKKEEVARDLPPKSVIVRTVELEGGQRDLYETVRSTMDAKVRDEIARIGFARSQIVILDALLKLRQTCCDPRLLKSGAAAKVKERAKLDLLMAMLPELVDEGRRVLVFSQFAEMLDLIEAELGRAKLDFVRLSGRTKDRETPVRRFQDGEVPVFLISLKAGGVGLNLTAADTVIHYDPWWNPAAENQATDRAHRIGQTKQVFVYKLIVAGSIEEKILSLQDRKAALAEGLLSDDAEALTKFSPDDIAALLAPLPG